MKRLYLVRHAKSDWSSIGLADFDRPLNKRGRRDAKSMGKYLKRVWQGEPDYVLCSTAQARAIYGQAIAQITQFFQKTDRMARAHLFGA